MWFFQGLCPWRMTTRSEVRIGRQAPTARGRRSFAGGFRGGVGGDLRRQGGAGRGGLHLLLEKDFAQRAGLVVVNAVGVIRRSNGAAFDGSATVETLAVVKHEDGGFEGRNRGLG